MDADILPPSDDRVFKLILTSPESKAGLMRLISAVIGRRGVDVALFPNELGLSDTKEKTERFDVNCKIDDKSQINLEMQSSRMIEDLDGRHFFFRYAPDPKSLFSISPRTSWAAFPPRLR